VERSVFARIRLIVFASIFVALLSAAAPVAATTVGTTQGCTPGYWKNHPQSWQEVSPSQSIVSVYSGASASPYGGLSLLQGLSLQGGLGVTGAQQILLRAAIAALLNAAYDPLLYPWQRDGSAFRPPLISTVNAALTSGDRTTILALATQLDADNNLGCPLN
jgi:hypothetical protein